MVCYIAITLFLLSVSSTVELVSSFYGSSYYGNIHAIKFKGTTYHHYPLRQETSSILFSSSDIDTDSVYDQVDEPAVSSDDVFGAEFKADDKELGSSQLVKASTYYRGSVKYTNIPAEQRDKVMDGYNNLRVTFLLDNLFISSLGLCLMWSFGTYKDAFSYGIGSLLGLGYATLLGRYVESLGGGQGGGGGGAARFAPVLLLILLYSKNKEYISIIPEILGFFTFQIASLLQIFNEDAYGDSNKTGN
jgi:hypothetical protein